MTRTHPLITAAAALAFVAPATALAGEDAEPRTTAASDDDCSGDDCDDDDIVVDCAAEDDDDCDADASGRASCNATVAPDVAHGLTGMLLSLGVVGLHLRRRRA
jgi:hypothetical protein